MIIYKSLYKSFARRSLAAARGKIIIQIIERRRPSRMSIKIIRSDVDRQQITE